MNEQRRVRERKRGGREFQGLEPINKNGLQKRNVKYKSVFVCFTFNINLLFHSYILLKNLVWTTDHIWRLPEKAGS